MSEAWCYEHFLCLFASSRWIASCIPQLYVALDKSVCKMTKCKCKRGFALVQADSKSGPKTLHFNGQSAYSFRFGWDRRWSRYSRHSSCFHLHHGDVGGAHRSIQWRGSGVEGYEVMLRLHCTLRHHPETSRTLIGPELLVRNLLRLRRPIGRGVFSLLSVTRGQRVWVDQRVSAAVWDRVCDGSTSIHAQRQSLQGRPELVPPIALNAHSNPPWTKTLLWEIRLYLTNGARVIVRIEAFLATQSTL